MQEVEFAYEIVIGDDASSDSTRDIIEEYQKNYPSLIKAYLRNENMGMKGANNALDLINKCKGKYIIALEGDDFWIDPNKLSKQVEFMETHPSYIAIAHNCVVVGADSEPINELYPQSYETEYSFKMYASGILPGQLTTVLYRNVYRDGKVNTSILNRKLIPMDRLIYFMLLCNGKIYCLQECCSAYRHITQGGFSYSANVVWDYETAKGWNICLRDYAYEQHHKEAIKYSELMLMKTIIGSRKRCSNDWIFIINELVLYKFSLLRYVQYGGQLIKRKVLKRRKWA